MNLDRQRLYGQFLQKQQLKQSCLRQGEENSLLHQKSEKLLALSRVAAEAGEDLDFSKVLSKEALALRSYLDELRTAYQELPESIRGSLPGKQMKNTMIMTGAALHRLEEAAAAPAEDLSARLEEAAFLLEGADGRA